jgi:hypothetical protein
VACLTNLDPSDPTLPVHAVKTTKAEAQLSFRLRFVTDSSSTEIEVGDA